MRKYLYLTILYGLLVIGLHLFSGRFTPLTSWGFYHFLEFPRPVALLACAVAAILCLPPANSAVLAFLARLNRKGSSLPFGLSPHLLYLLIGIAFIALFWFFRSGNLFLGDGVTVAKVARTDDAFRYYVGGWAGHVTSHQALDYGVARVLHKLSSGITGFESYETVALRNCLAGGLFVFVVLETAHLLCEHAGRRAAFSAAVFTTGAMQLFFGYVETYSLATAFLALFCLATLLYARGKITVWAPALALAVTASLHLLTAGAGLALLFAYVYRSSARRKFSKIEFAVIASIPLMVAGVYLIIFHSMGFTLGEIFFPEARKDYEGVFFLSLQRKGYLLERYTLFSVPHLIDIANESLLVAPFGLFFCLLALPALIASWRGHGTPCPPNQNAEAVSSTSGENKSLIQPEPWIFFLTAAVYLAVTLTSAPLLGARKDWDVFAPPWIFITMLGAYLLMRVITDERLLGRLFLVTLSVSLLGSVPWIYSNARADLDEYLAELGRGDFYLSENLQGRALEHYEQALKINFTPELAYKVARLRLRGGDMNGAAEILVKAIREENRSELALFLEQEDAHFALGSIYLAQRKHDEAISEFNKALDLWRFRRNENFTRAADVYYHLGVAHLEKGDREAAKKALGKSIETGDVPAAHLALARLFANEPKNRQLALEHVKAYVQRHPADAAGAKLLEELKAAAQPPEE